MKKPFYKKWWFWVIVVIIVAAAAGGNSGDKKEEAKTTSTEPKQEAKQEQPKKEEAKKEETKAEDNVPVEYKSALKKAESYAKTMNMSKQGIYDQLVSEHGEKFSAESANYAMNNLEFDWKA
ncbi:immunity protein, partial [Bacillus pseudomycoides]